MTKTIDITNITNEIASERTKVDAAVVALNAALSTNKHNDIVAKQSELAESIAAHNKLVTTKLFLELSAEDNTMLSAIKMMTYNVLKSTSTKNKDTGVVTYSVENTTAYINLEDLDLFCRSREKKIASNDFFVSRIEKFAQLVSLRVCTDLKLDVAKIKKSYYISTVARDIDLGKTPTSNTQMLKQLQMVLDAIIYVDDNGKNKYKVSSHDVEFIRSTMTRHGKAAQSVSLPKVSTMLTLVLEVANRVVENKHYTAEYAIDKKTATASENETSGVADATTTA